MMLASVLPSLFYILGRSLIFSSYFGGRDEEDRGSASILIIGFLSMIIYFILSLFVLHLSRIREYYADNFSVNLSSTRKDGARNLMSALAKIVRYTGILKNKGATIKTLGFKELFIADPDITEKEIREASKFIGEDRFINEILNKRITFADKIMEIFSTHPNIVNRFQALYSYITESSS